MAFSCELLCRACMEPFSGNSMPLINKKRKKKTSICSNFEELTCLKVKESDKLPMQLCLACVSELNKCFAFREKCVRTNNTLRTYLDLSEDEESDDDQLIVLQEKPEKASKQNATHRDEKRNIYEEIEVTHEMVDAAKSRRTIHQVDDANTDMVLEMEEITNLLNPTTSSSVGFQGKNADSNDELVFIIQDVTQPNTSATLVQTSHKNDSQDDLEENREKFRCSTCEMEFVRKKNFDNHLKRFHHGEDEENGPETKRLRLRLSKEKPEMEQVKQELEDNPESKKCKICGALYLNEKSLKLHERRNACKQESHQCSVCNKIFTDLKLFTEHTTNHPQQPQEESLADVPSDPSKKFSCNVCHRGFKMMSTLKDHLRTHTGDKPFKCTICGRGFSQNTNLKQHLRRHTQIKPFKCTYEKCEGAFVSKGELDSHNRKHTGEHPFTCDQCDAGFTTSSSLLKHKRIHSGEKPYACEFCPMRFTALGTLRNHTRTHTGEKPHKCRYCERAFTQKSDMSAHERTHTGDRPYSCKICSSAFHQSGTLKTHMKIHKNSLVDEEDEAE